MSDSGMSVSQLQGVQFAREFHNGWMQGMKFFVMRELSSRLFLLLSACPGEPLCFTQPSHAVRPSLLICRQLPLGTKCDSTKGTPPCDSIGAMDCKTCTRLNAVRASVVIAAGFGLLAFAFSAGPACSDLCVRKSQSNGIIVMSLFSALWMLIGVAIYADHFEDVGDFGYSLILGGCAAGLYTLGALFGYLAK